MTTSLGSWDSPKPEVKLINTYLFNRQNLPASVQAYEEGSSAVKAAAAIEAHSMASRWLNHSVIKDVKQLESIIDRQTSSDILGLISSAPLGDHDRPWVTSPSKRP